MSKAKIVTGAAKIAARVMKNPTAQKIAAGVAVGTTVHNKARKVAQSLLGEEAGYKVTRNYPEHIKEGIERIKKGETFRGIMQILFNHKEWYTNYDVSGLVNANFGINKAMHSMAINVNNHFGATSTAGVEVDLLIPIQEVDGWQQGIQYMWTQIRSANSGAINYSAFDLEKYVQCVRILHAHYCELRRAFAALKNISHYDAGTPATIFAAMGLDYDTFSLNAANLKMFGNKLATIINKLFPLDIDLIKRTRWMFSSLFADSNDAKATYYVPTFRQAPYALPGDTTAYVAYGGDVGNLSSTQTGVPYANYIAGVELLLKQMVENQVFNVIAGDILKAFGQNAVYPTEIWDENMESPVVFDEAILTQIQNADIADTGSYPSLSSASDTAWMKDTQSVVCNAGVDDRDVDIMNDGLINTYKDNMDAGDVLAATRFKLRLFKYTESGSTYYRVSSCGTEKINSIEYFCKDDTQTNAYQIWGVANFGRNIGTTVTHAASSWAQVDYSPRMRFGAYILFDLNNYALAGKQNIDAYHEYATLSLLAVPRLVKVNRTELIK